MTPHRRSCEGNRSAAGSLQSGEMWRRISTVVLPALCAGVALALAIVPAAAQSSRTKTPAAKNPSAKSLVPPAPPAPVELLVPFRPGEQLNFRVNWSRLFDAANVRIAALARMDYYGTPSWHFQAIAHSVHPLRLVYALDDQFDSYSDAANIHTRQYEMYLKEQGKEENSVYLLASDAAPRHGSGVIVQVTPGTRDPIAFLYYLRSVDWSKTPEVKAPVWDGKKLYEVRARVGAPRVDVNVAAGKFSASRVDVRVFERGKELTDTRFRLWLAQDAARTPVILEAELPFGSAHIELKSSETPR